MAQCQAAVGTDLIARYRARAKVRDECETSVVRDRGPAHLALGVTNGAADERELTCVRHGCTIEQAGYRLFPNDQRHLKTPHEFVVSALRAIIGRKQILAPGVGAQGGKASEAIVAGADAVIVGRAIYEAANPAAAASAIATEIRSVVSR